MLEKLIIQNFGPIKSVDLDLRRFNVLIGENGTGKSTIAKLLAVCRYFSYLQDATTFEDGLEAWGLRGKAFNSLDVKPFIRYECDDYVFIASFGLREYFDEIGDKEGEYPEWSVQLMERSGKFSDLLQELERIKPKAKNVYDFNMINWNIPSSFFENDVKKVMRNPFYLRTERGLQSIFSLGKNTIGNLTDSLFNQFAILDQISRLFKQETSIEPLNISYINDNGKGLVKKDNEQSFYSLANAASGYQSTVPIVLLVKFYTEIKKKSKTFIVEEPELNLYPKAQNRLMQFIVEQITKSDGQILMTTHSPYVLTSLNNMLYAYEVGQNKQVETEKILEKKYWLNAGEVSVYRISPDGGSENILDKETNLIKAELLDEVSDDINLVYDHLSEINFGS